MLCPICLNSMFDQGLPTLWCGACGNVELRPSAEPSLDLVTLVGSSALFTADELAMDPIF